MKEVLDPWMEEFYFDDPFYQSLISALNFPIRRFSRPAQFRLLGSPMLSVEEALQVIGETMKDLKILTPRRQYEPKDCYFDLPLLRPDGNE